MPEDRYARALRKLKEAGLKSRLRRTQEKIGYAPRGEVPFPGEGRPELPVSRRPEVSTTPYKKRLAETREGMVYGGQPGSAFAPATEVTPGARLGPGGRPTGLTAGGGQPAGGRFAFERTRPSVSEVQAAERERLHQIQVAAAGKTLLSRENAEQIRAIKQYSPFAPGMSPELSALAKADPVIRHHWSIIQGVQKQLAKRAFRGEFAEQFNRSLDAITEQFAVLEEYVEAQRQEERAAELDRIYTERVKQGEAEDKAAEAEVAKQEAAEEKQAKEAEAKAAKETAAAEKRAKLDREHKARVFQIQKVDPAKADYEDILGDYKAADKGLKKHAAQSEGVAWSATTTEEEKEKWWADWKAKEATLKKEKEALSKRLEPAQKKWQKLAVDVEEMKAGKGEEKPAEEDYTQAEMDAAMEWAKTNYPHADDAFLLKEAKKRADLMRMAKGG